MLLTDAGISWYRVPLKSYNVQLHIRQQKVPIQSAMKLYLPLKTTKHKIRHWKRLSDIWPQSAESTSSVRLCRDGFRLCKKTCLLTGRRMSLARWLWGRLTRAANCRTTVTIDDTSCSTTFFFVNLLLLIAKKNYLLPNPHQSDSRTCKFLKFHV